MQEFCGSAVVTRFSGRSKSLRGRLRGLTRNFALGMLGECQSGPSRAVVISRRGVGKGTEFLTHPARNPGGFFVYVQRLDM